MSIDEALVRYIVDGDRRRAEAADAVYNGLSHREQQLVREAAVMGYVQGVRAVPGGHRETIPPDGDIVRLVISSCQSFEDLYPLLGGDIADMVRSLVRRVERAGRTTTRPAVVEAVVTLTGAAAEDVDAVVAGLIGDEVLEETSTGLRTAS